MPIRRSLQEPIQSVQVDVQLTRYGLELSRSRSLSPLQDLQRVMLRPPVTTPDLNQRLVTVNTRPTDEFEEVD
jgi:hypothetical protein